MASYLGDYPRAAKDRDVKFRRAIDSALAQTHADWELIVISDGCQRTMNILKEYTDPRITGELIPKEPQWSPTVRNVGLYRATGDVMVYLDTDDTFGPEHLAKLVIPEGFQWGYFNIMEWKRDRWAEMACSVTERWRCGTGNLAHVKGYWWPEKAKDYAHDWVFIQELRKHDPGVRLPTPSYFVMHLPDRYDL